MNIISIYIVDDHKVFRDGIASLLKYEEDIDVIGSAGSVQQFRSEIIDCLPDVILMDISIGEDNGIEATALIKEKKQMLKC